MTDIWERLSTVLAESRSAETKRDRERARYLAELAMEKFHRHRRGAVLARGVLQFVNSARGEIRR